MIHNSISLDKKPQFLLFQPHKGLFYIHRWQYSLNNIKWIWNLKVRPDNFMLECSSHTFLISYAVFAYAQATFIFISILMICYKTCMRIWAVGRQKKLETYLSSFSWWTPRQLMWRQQKLLHQQQWKPEPRQLGKLYNNQSCIN